MNYDFLMMTGASSIILLCYVYQYCAHRMRHQLLQSFFCFTNNGYAVISDHWRFEQISPSLSRLLGFGIVEIQFMDLQRLIQADSFNHHYKAIAAVRDGELRQHCVKATLLNHCGDLQTLTLQFSSFNQCAASSKLLCQFSIS